MKGRFLMRLAGRDESGFTLVETLVALVVATVVFTSLAYVAIGALRASMLSRTNQQATDLADQRVEQLRDLPFTGVAMDTADLTGDPNIVACGAYKCVTLGDGTQERVYTAVGGITPHTTTQQSTSTNQVTFTMRTYVTTPASDGSGSVYRRISVEISWKQGETTLTRWVSTIVAYSQRGLPLPVFKLTPLGATTASVTANGAQAVYGFSLNNQGARDAWNLTMSGTRDWTFYLDNGDGVFDATSDAVMTDHTSDLKVDTDYLSPTESVRFWVVSTVATGTATGSTTYTLTAKSVLQPAATSGTATSAMTLTILAPGATASATTTPTTPGPTGTAAPTTCAAGTVPAYTAPTGYTNVAFSLHNRSAANPAWPPAPYPATDPITSTSTGTQGIPLTMANDGFAVPAGRELPVFSSDLSTAQGRVLNNGGSATTGDTSKVVDWRTNIDKKSYSGSAVLTFWVAAVPGDTLSTVTLQTQLYKWVKSGKAYVQTNLGTPVTLTINPFTCAGFQQVVATFTGSQVTTGSLTASQFLGVRVWNSGSTRVRLAYDVTGTYPATLTVPWK